jgi:UDP-2-acetamido-3-amino-2,3-dideoxy-glucuronate N-acetyltransferase
MSNVRIHSSAEVSNAAQIGDGASIWHQAQIREHATIGSDSIIGKGVYVDAGVQIGHRVKIQNYVSVFHGVTIEDGVFIGPHVCFTNDLRPRAINSDGSLKTAEDWSVAETRVQYGAAVGANATIKAGITIGKWAMIGAGSVVTRSVPDYGLAFGNPARLRGFVCPCGEQVEHAPQHPNSSNDSVELACLHCERRITVSKAIYDSVYRDSMLLQAKDCS